MTKRFFAPCAEYHPQCPSCRQGNYENAEYLRLHLPPAAPAPAPAPLDECLSCMDAKPDTRMVPCGCRAACRECALELSRRNQNRCLRCQRIITSIEIDVRGRPT